MKKDYSELDSFVILMAVSERFVLKYEMVKKSLIRENVF